MKAVSDVIAPLSGEITAVNEALSDSPGEDQRGSLRGGLAGQGEAHRPAEVDELLDAAAYRQLLADD